MIIRKVFLYALLALVALAFQNKAAALAQQEQSKVPGDGDIAIMQKEIKWGMQEMQRYKTIRGAWPVRIMGGDDDEGAENTMQLETARKNRQDEEKQRVRGAAKAEEDSHHSSYWNLLVSVF